MKVPRNLPLHHPYVTPFLLLFIFVAALVKPTALGRGDGVVDLGSRLALCGR